MTETGQASAACMTASRSAAVTALLFEPLMAMPLEEPEFVEMTVDRPFLFVIADDASGVIAFAGVVAEA